MEPVHPEAPLNLFISFSAIHTWVYMFSSSKFMGPAHGAVVWSLSFMFISLGPQNSSWC